MLLSGSLRIPVLQHRSPLSLALVAVVSTTLFAVGLVLWGFVSEFKADSAFAPRPVSPSFTVEYWLVAACDSMAGVAVVFSILAQQRGLPRSGIARSMLEDGILFMFGELKVLRPRNFEIYSDPSAFPTQSPLLPIYRLLSSLLRAQPMLSQLSEAWQSAS